jgi:hypothetical protein
MMDILPPHSFLVAVAAVLVSISLKAKAVVNALAMCGILEDKRSTVKSKLKELEVISKDPLENLELMKRIVDLVKADEEFARNVYADCPRLQSLLTRHPDLRSFFESPRFIMINFQKVYDDAVRDLVSAHPLFWVFETLARIHRVVMCPIHIYKFIKTCFCAPLLNDERFVPIYNAANRLEDPDIQAQLHEAIAGDPSLLEHFVATHEDLRTLRDSDPLYAEIMSNPDTFRIISIPDNLRALVYARELIELDILDPDGEKEDAEAVVGRTSTAKDAVNVVVVERTAAKRQNNLSELSGFVAGFVGALVVSWISSVAVRTHMMD